MIAMTPQDVIRIYTLLTSNGVDVWICGGWGVDALLGQVTRSHADLDVLIRSDQLSRFWDLVSAEGFELGQTWSETHWITDSSGVRRATAFVASNKGNKLIDVHVLSCGEHGTLTPAWDTGGMTFAPGDLAAVGSIEGLSVRCISVALQFVAHTGYDLPPAHVIDVQRLHARFPSAEGNS